MKVIKTNPKVELSTEEFKALDDARFILAEILDLLDDGYDTTLFTDNIKWEYKEIDNAIILLDSLAQGEIILKED